MISQQSVELAYALLGQLQLNGVGAVIGIVVALLHIARVHHSLAQTGIIRIGEGQGILAHRREQHGHGGIIGSFRHSQHDLLILNLHARIARYQLGAGFKHFGGGFERLGKISVGHISLLGSNGIAITAAQRSGGHDGFAPVFIDGVGNEGHLAIEGFLMIAVVVMDGHHLGVAALDAQESARDGGGQQRQQHDRADYAIENNVLRHGKQFLLCGIF